MSDMTIDEATADTQVTGVEKLPASDGGTAKSVTTAQIRDFVLAELAASDAASSTDLSEDGIYVKQGGATKRLTGTTLAQAVLGYACTLAGIVGPNGNEIFLIDDAGTKKTITLAQVAAYITANSGDMFADLGNAGTMAGSDLVMVKQGSAVKKGTLANLAAFALGTFASFVASQSSVSTVDGTEKIAVVSGGVTKYVTLSQIVAEGGSVVAPSATTAGNVPTWGDSAGGSLGAGLAVGTTIRAQGAADNNTIPTEAAVRAAIGNGNVTGPNSTTENKIPQWDQAAKTLKDGLTLATSVATPGVDSKVPTERAVRLAISAAMDGVGTGDVQKSGTPTSGSIAEWTAGGKIEGGHTVTETVGVTGADTALPTEKAVRTAITNATADAISKSGTPTSGKLAKFSGASTVVNGPGVVTSVGDTGSNSDVPTEKAVRDAIDAAIDDALETAASDATTKANAAAATVASKVSAPASHTENNIPTWGASNELKAGKAVVTVLASNGSNDNIPTEKAVRDALPVAATTSTAGLMSAADKTKLDNLVDTTAVEEVGDTGLGDSDVITVLKGGTTWKRSLITRVWTWLMGKLPSFRLDDLGEPDDNTDNNANTSRHGLCPKFPNDATKFLRGDGTFAEPPGTTDFTGDSGSGGTHGLVPAPATGDAIANKFLNANGQWVVPPSAAGVDIPGSTAIDAAAADDALICFDASANAYRKLTLAQLLALSGSTKRYETLFVPAGAMIPGAENPATAGSVTFTNVKHDTMAFGSSEDQTAEFDVVMPEGWDKESVKVKALWTYYNSTLGQAGQHVKFLVGAISYADGEDVSDMPTNPVSVTDQAQSANELCRTGASASLTPDGTAGNGNMLHFTVTRDADYAPDGGDALPTDALLLGVIIQYGKSEVASAW